MRLVHGWPILHARMCFKCVFRSQKKPSQFAILLLSQTHFDAECATNGDDHFIPHTVTAHEKRRKMDLKQN